MKSLGLKRVPRKYQYPVMISMTLPTMLLAMPAIVTYQNLAEGEPFMPAWLNTLSQVVPAALTVFVIVAPLVRLFVTRVLLAPE